MKNGNADSLYYVYTDYLGSWEVVTDESGALTERMYYDAWGSRVDSIGAPVPYTKSFIFDRGFTGHEHHDVFCLINMNGRMYDPVVGVMLSPDRFMTDPLQTDDYNLFAYAWNNPLKYTDPTGWNEGWFTWEDEEGQHIDWHEGKSEDFKGEDGIEYKYIAEKVRFLDEQGNTIGYGDSDGQRKATLATVVITGTKPANPTVKDGDAGDAAQVIQRSQQVGFTINYQANAKKSAVSSRSEMVLKEIMVNSGNKSITISSTTRTPQDQARIMYNNIKQYGKGKQKALYGPNGDQVIDQYPDQAKMLAKIIKLGPSNVSKHCADPSVLNVVDIAPSSIKNKTAFIRAINNHPYVSKFLQPPADPAYHIEIRQK